MNRTHVRKLSSLVLAVGLMAGVSGALAAPASAATPKPKKFTTVSTFTTNSVNPDGSFSAPFLGTSPKGASSDSTLDGVTTQGPKPITKTNVVLSNVPVGGSGTANGFSAPVSSPWLVGTVSGTVSPPTGFGPPAFVKIIIKCVCNWNSRSWSWRVIISWTSSPE
jgi:hypothetical protein